MGGKAGFHWQRLVNVSQPCPIPFRSQFEMVPVSTCHIGTTSYIRALSKQSWHPFRSLILVRPQICGGLTTGLGSSQAR